MSNYQRILLILAIALVVFVLGYCKAQGMTVTIEFKSPEEIAAVKNSEEYRPQAVTFYRPGSNTATIWMPNTSTDVSLLAHELCHLQSDPTNPRKMKSHTADGTWKHTGRKDRC